MKILSCDLLVNRFKSYVAGQWW